MATRAPRQLGRRSPPPAHPYLLAHHSSRCASPFYPTHLNPTVKSACGRLTCFPANASEPRIPEAAKAKVKDREAEAWRRAARRGHGGRNPILRKRARACRPVSMLIGKDETP